MLSKSGVLLLDVNVELMADVKAKIKVNGSVNEDQIPSSTRIWRAERAKKMNKST